MPMATLIVLGLAALLCSLVAGFLFAFAVVVMPGIGTLGDRDFLKAFQAADRVIQRGQPIFGIVWMGSVLAAIAALVVAFAQMGGPDRLLVVLAGAVYLLGVQAPTFVINIPLNNEVLALDLDRADEPTLRTLRQRFEPRWNRANLVRTMLAVLVSAVFLVALARV